MEECDPTTEKLQPSQNTTSSNTVKFSAPGFTKSLEQIVAEHPVRQRLALQEQRDQKSSNLTLRSVFKKVVWSTYNSVMKLRTNREKNTTNNGNKNGVRTAGEAELGELVDQAEYEIHQDPYRGVLLKYAPSTSLTATTARKAQSTDTTNNESISNDGVASSSATVASSASNSSSAHAILKDDGSTVTTTSTPTISNCTSPWTTCLWGSVTTTSNMVVPSSTNSSSINSNFQDQDPEELVRQICHCSCPSLEAWTRNRIKISSRKSGKKRGRAAAAASKTIEDDLLEEENELTRLIQVTGRHQNSQSQEQKTVDDRYRCACDYNPFCLGTLGGIVNEVLVDRSLEVAKTALTARRNHRKLLGTINEDSKPPSGDSSDSIDIDANESQPQSRGMVVDDSRSKILSPSKPKSGNSDAMVVVETPPRDSLQFLDQKKRAVDKDTEGENSSEQKPTSRKKQMTYDNFTAKSDDVFAFLGDGEKTAQTSNKRRREGIDGEEEDLIIPTPPLKRLRRAGDDNGEETNSPTVLREIVASIYNDETDSALQIHDISGTETSSASSGNNSILAIPTYSKQTQEELNLVRKTRSVEAAPIRSYVYRTLHVGHMSSPSGANENNLTLDKYMEKLRQWYQSILFVNPLNSSNGENASAVGRDSERLDIAIPPGIQNLGATCYLNTQLQCLAQNTAFLKGIFSWRSHQETKSNFNGSSSDKSDPKLNAMNSVMSRLQLLLARMVLGGDGKVSTIDFSNALGLEHDEQQDPNEFARLLFEKMDESFQQCAATARSRSSDDNEDYGENGGDLSNLMHRIFHGVTTYETTCMSCNTTSERREAFMDVNIPIVKPTMAASGVSADISNSSGKGGADSKKAPKQTTILDSLNTAGGFKSDGSAPRTKKTKNKNIDTDLQYCLEQYTCAEFLEGDNQYWCSSCNCKRDAKRELKFTELPPVLNVQLSRYVFDREKYVKKKLSDKVLLPTVLEIPKGASKEGSSGKHVEGDDQYLLCAVMRHQGTSAYHGHYVAEAMDWLSGQWFEFNDETVKLLPDGPSCSYDPQCLPESGDDSSGDFFAKFSTSDASGSQDAYNMYYVQSSFLEKNATSSLLQREQLITSINSRKDDSAGEDSKYDALINVSKNRDSKYSHLTEKCFADWRTSDRLRRRRSGIRRVMFVDASSLATNLSSTANVPSSVEKRQDDLPVWVAADPLRKFLSCGTELDTRLHGNGPLLCHQRLLCEHNGLHPRVARRGKLLPRNLYDAFISLLEGERKLLRKQMGNPPSRDDDPQTSDEMNDCMITPAMHLFCRKCSGYYRTELAEKLEFIMCLKVLYEDLAPSARDCSLDYDEQLEPIPCLEEGFAYVISRQFITKFRKQVSTTLKSVANFVDGTTVSFADDGAARSVVSEGLDAVDISAFKGQESSNTFGPKDTPKTIKEQDKLDVRVNSAISCPHGRCDISKINKRTVRYISWKVWSTLKKVFPEAIEHKRRRKTSSEALAVNDNGDDDDLGCHLCEREKVALERMRTHLKDWADKTSENSELEALVESKTDCPRENLVHNFTNSRRGCRVVHIADIRNWKKVVSKLSDIDKFDAGDWSGLKAQVEQIAFPSTHSVVLDFEREPSQRLLASLRSLICTNHHKAIKSVVFEACQSGDRSKLSKHIMVLSDDEHEAYIESLTELLRHIYDEDEGLAIGSMASPVVVDGAKKTPKYMHHVKEAADSYHPSIRLSDTKTESPAENCMSFSLADSEKLFVMSPGVCACETCEKEFASLLQEPIHTTRNDMKVAASNKTSAGSAGSAAADPILVESDAEDVPPDTFALRVFELNDDGLQPDVIKALKEVQAIPGDSTDGAGTITGYLRRSTRKKKSRFPVGPILGEGTIRVGLHYNFAAIKLLLYQGCEVPVFGYRLSLVVASEESPQEEWIDIEPSWSNKELKELVDGAKAKLQSTDDDDLDPSKSLSLLYRKETSDSDASLRENNASVMDSLLELSNISAPDDSSKKASNGGKGKRRPAERGFRGTFLQASPGVAEPKKPSEEDEHDNDQNVPPKTDISEVSDEEKDSPRVVVEDSTPKPVAPVLSDDNSSVDEEPPPFSGLRRRPGSNSRSPVVPNSNGTHMIEVENDDDSSVEAVVVRPNDGRRVAQPSPGSSTTSRVVEEPPSPQFDCSLDGRTAEIASKLAEIVNQPVDQCWDAAAWAAQSNPSGDNPALIDSAYAKYLEDSENNN